MEQRKGLTPIIAVVLLLMMTVAAAGLAYQFVIGTQSDVQDKVANQVETQFGSADLAFKVENVANSSTGLMAVSIRNTGKAGITADSMTVYIDGVQVAASVNVPDVALATGSVSAQVALTGHNFPTLGNRKVIRIVHASGTETTYTCTNSNNAAYC